MPDTQRVAVLVERNRLHVDTGQRNVRTPRVPSAVTGRVAEVVVVIHFGERGVEVVVAVDIGRHAVRNEYERHREGQNAATSPRAAGSLEEPPGPPTSFHNVRLERSGRLIVGSGVPKAREEPVKDVRVRSRLAPLEDRHLLEWTGAVPRRQGGVDRSARLGSRETAGRHPVTGYDQVGDVVAVGEAPRIARDRAETLLMNANAGPAHADSEVIDPLDRDI